jgi:MoaA/NifB/PqqE/SkfB family radical SAM enzyme
LDLLIDDICNLKCSYCNIWNTRVNGKLSLSQWNKIFVKYGNYISVLSISGGEPFLSRKLIPIIKIIRSKCKNLSVISMATNGYSSKFILSNVKSIFKLIGDNIDFIITISIDGEKEIHNKLRGDDSSYQNAIKTYNLIFNYKKKNKIKNLHVEFEHTINSTNIDSIINFIEVNNYPHTLTFAMNSWEYDNLDKKIDSINSDKLLSLIRLSIKKSKLEILQNIFLIFSYFYYNKDRRKSKLKYVPCYSLYSFVKINANGDVYPCSGKNIILGNLKKFDFNLVNILDSIPFKMRNLVKKCNIDGCWTPCSTYFSIIQNPLFFCYGFFVILYYNVNHFLKGVFRK